VRSSRRCRHRGSSARSLSKSGLGQRFKSAERFIAVKTITEFGTVYAVDIAPSRSYDASALTLAKGLIPTCSFSFLIAALFFPCSQGTKLA
jgi:hypothetical protein